MRHEPLAWLAAVVLIVSGCGGSTKRSFSAGEVTRTFDAHGLRLHDFAAPSCPRHLPRRIGPSKTQLTCIRVALPLLRPAPLAALVAKADRGARYILVTVYANPDAVRSLLRSRRLPAHDFFSNDVLRYLHRANVVVTCDRCSTGTVGIVEKALNDL